MKIEYLRVNEVIIKMMAPMKVLKRSTHGILFRGTLFLLFSFLSACSLSTNSIDGDGNVIEEERSVKTFKNLENKGIIDLTLVKGEGPLILRTDSNLLPYLKTKVQDSTLTLELEKNVSTRSNMEVKIPVQEDQLKRIRNRGTGNIRSEFTLKGKTLSIDNGGTGDVKMDLELGKFEYSGSGTGDAYFEGSTSLCRIKKSGTGEVKALGLKTEELQCNSSGTGDIEITVTETLHVDASGTGDIRYKGDPELEEVSLNGTADLIQMEGH